MERILYNKKLQGGLCLFLVLAIIIGILFPGSELKTASPKNPLGDDFYGINALLMGEEEEGKTGNLSTEKEEELTEDESESSEGNPENTGEGEGESTETKPNDQMPNEEKSEETEDEQQSTGDGDEGQEDGNVGEEGGELSELDIAMVMSWYKYGTDEKTIVCGPSDAVSKTINTAQLIDNELKYKFFTAGEDANKIDIYGVSVKEGDGTYREIFENGKITIELPDANSERDYTFVVDAVYKTKDENGKPVEQDVTFTYVLHCGYSMDLEMELHWEKTGGSQSVITCSANNSAARTINSSDLTDNTLNYTPSLIGALAEDAEIIEAEYTTASGQKGSLNKNGGSLVLRCANGSDRETYYLTFEVKSGENPQTIFYHFTIVYVNTMDVQLSFTWLEKGTTPRLLVCQPDSSVSTKVKNNKLSAGTVKYEMELTGKDAENAKILNISYTSDATGGGKLSESGAIPVNLPEGYSSNTYKVQVLAIVGGKQVSFEIYLHFSSDVTLEMQYSVIENGGNSGRVVTCENGKTKNAEAIYDDQLENGILDYSMSVGGEDASDIAIKSVTCYQSGNGRTVALGSADSIALLLENGKTGENTFIVTAGDSAGAEYSFKISIPYKHRGENTIKISTNMIDGQVVTNETETNLSVNAWSEDAEGNVVDTIPANGTDTKLIVTFDGEQLSYVSSSGSASEYKFIPKNPEKGDTNTHVLHIYAEDAFGNYGELTLNLKGQRNQAGQKKGTATIYIDLSVLGLGVVESISYEVLADEPVSYVVAKAVLGMDTGDTFGSVENSLGWLGRYSGTLDTGFYLSSLTPGLSANALDGSSWNQYGSTEAEILQSIDDIFGRGTGLATLWRCIYRNGLNKSAGSDGTFGEFDFSSGSGWVFSIDGSYYPGQSMSDYKLEDGDVLTLRYTLAYGWDIGGGTTGYGNTAGYCVTAINGSFTINHQMEEVTGENGAVTYVCKCCGLEEGCSHENAVPMDMGDGTHITYCDDCGTFMGDYEDHIWEDNGENHTCSVCGAEESHNWKEIEGSNTATCTEGGMVSVSCVYCGTTAEEESDPNGHSLDERWNHTAEEHYQKCSVCEEIIEESKGRHEYEYDENDEDWYCEICDAGHDWDYCGNDALEITSATCEEITYYCPDCDTEMTWEGYFPEHHEFEDGYCIYCGEEDPAWIPPDDEDEDE
ncbi:MAG: hypothetical protein IKL18_05035 [Oscillospiraceae bacterium]|nr:hypothetical protein [Oscillospiraceae bacterium]